MTEIQDSAGDSPVVGSESDTAKDAGRQVSGEFVAVRTQLANRRRELGMSMSELARQVQLSPSMVSQIERGQALPSVPTLFAMASVLGATVDAFFEEVAGSETTTTDSGPRGVRRLSDAAAGKHWVAADERATVSMKGGIRWERLTPRAMAGVEFLELVYQPKAESDSDMYSHSGMEMVVVLAGRLDVYVGFDCFSLGPGDSVEFESRQPHRYVNAGTEEMRAITVILDDEVYRAVIDHSDALGPPRAASQA